MENRKNFSPGIDLHIAAGALVIVLATTSYLCLLLVAELAIRAIWDAGGRLTFGSDLSLLVLPISKEYAYISSIFICAFHIILWLYFALRMPRKLITLIVLELCITFLVISYCVVSIGATLSLYH